MTDSSNNIPTPASTHADTPPAAEATLIFRRQEFSARPGSTVRAAIKAVGMNPEVVLATRGGKLITDEVIILPGDRIKLIATISGG